MADDRGYVIIALVGTLLPLVTGIVGLRFYTRSSLVKSIGPDDWSILLALVRKSKQGKDLAGSGGLTSVHSCSRSQQA